MPHLEKDSLAWSFAATGRGQRPEFSGYFRTVGLTVVAFGTGKSAESQRKNLPWE